MRLIDADELAERLWRFELGTREQVAGLVATMPTIEAISAEEHAEIVGKLCAKFAEEIKDFEPIRHGHWIYTERGFPLAYGYNRCSVCGRSIGLDSTDYCPNCGAKMDEVTEDE